MSEQMSEQTSKQTSEQNTTNLEELYNQSIKRVRDGQLIKGKIIAIKSKEVLVDVGFKSEGVLPIVEFKPDELEIGRDLDFLVESVEDDKGMIVLSHTRAKQIQAWNKIVTACKEGNLIDGMIMRSVKGGFLVNIDSIEGFLPRSLSGFRDAAGKDIIGKKIKFKITKLNQFRRSAVVSRREAMQQEKQKARLVLWENLKVGEIVSGTVKAITDFGAFIDLGGIDGLLHITDMSWAHLSHPSEVVAVGNKLEVMVLNIDKERNKIALGLKQRFPDPWSEVLNKYPPSSKVTGKVVNVVPYGIFVELEKGIEGLVHISEVSWAKKIDNLSSIFAIGDIVETIVLFADQQNRKISLSIKQLEQNPWLEAQDKYLKGSKVLGKVRGITDYGVFVELDNNIEGLIHISDLSWTKRINHPQDVLKKGQKVEVVVLSCDAQNQRISLGLKQVIPNPWSEIAQRYPIGKELEVEVASITDFGVFVKLEENLDGLVFKDEIEPQLLTQLNPGDKMKVKVIKVDVEQAKIGLSARIGDGSR
ncbi:MAG: 30S ribosomal protein S1 [Candidatus Omnitrophica bacterium]|nr:30S ribosomal protein S1 [Candidatus Omnitrophota bacterium]